MSYDLLFDYLQDGDVVYMDPPYQGTSKKKDSRYLEGLKVEDFINSLEFLNRNRVPYLFSYDGTLGEKKYGIELPSYLNLEKVSIKTGRSTTSTLNGKKEETIESLYISNFLVEMNRKKCYAITQPIQMQMNLT